MAQVGNILATPESGWVRIDNTDARIKYEGTWTHVSNSNDYNGTESYSNVVGSKIKFKFYGSSLRILGVKHSDSASNVEISIDGNVDIFSFYGTPLSYKMVLYEKYLDSDSLHEVEITLKQAMYMRFDAFDIDYNGQMAGTVGASLPIPDRGWLRFDGSYPAINYIGAGWTIQSDIAHYGGSMHYNQTVSGTKIVFEFVGSRLRFIGMTYPTHSASIVIVIDGISNTFSQRGTQVNSCLEFEKTGLTWGTHSVEIYSTETYGVRLDAIDIDENGYLSVAQSPPSTGGVLRTRISDMMVGDYIRCGYSAPSAAAGQFFGLGVSSEVVEIPRDGTTTPNGYFYFVKVKEGLLIADRIVQYGVSWLTLNTAGYTHGVILNDSLIPIMANDTSPAVIMPPSGSLSASQVYTSAYAAWKTSDGVDGPWGWIMPQNIRQGWLEYRFYNPKVVRKYQLKAPTNPTSMPSIWSFEAWDGRQWVVLDRQTYSGWFSLEERVYPVSNGKAYSRYRIVIEKNDGHATYTGIGELRLGADPIITKVRMMTGGIAYMRFDGYPSTADQGLGMFPAGNEWDNFIKDSPWDSSLWGYTNGVIEGEWTQDTPFNGFTSVPSGFTNNGLGRTIRGHLGSPIEYWSTLGTYTSPSKIGFRPVLEYDYL